MLTLLLAILLEEALYNSATGVLDVTTLIRNLELLELNNGGNIGINSTLYKEGPF
jgi:hypothetical protein